MKTVTTYSTATSSTSKAINKGCFTCQLAEPTYSSHNGVMRVFCNKKNVILDEKEKCYYYIMSNFKSSLKTT